MPLIKLPKPSPTRGLSQEGKVLRATKNKHGVTNWELSRIALKYTSVISALRKDGHNIVAERQYLKNGRPSNTWKYYLIGE